MTLKQEAHLRELFQVSNRDRRHLEATPCFRQNQPFGREPVQYLA